MQSGCSCGYVHSSIVSARAGASVAIHCPLLDPGNPQHLRVCRYLLRNPGRCRTDSAGCVGLELGPGPDVGAQACPAAHLAWFRESGGRSWTLWLIVSFNDRPVSDGESPAWRPAVSPRRRSIAILSYGDTVAGRFSAFCPATDLVGVSGRSRNPGRFDGRRVHRTHTESLKRRVGGLRSVTLLTSFQLTRPARIPHRNDLYSVQDQAASFRGH